MKSTLRKYLSAT